MDKIFIEASLGELLDKISILEIKSDKICAMNITNNRCLNLFLNPG